MAHPLLDDALWARLEPLLPKPRRRARRRGGRPRSPGARRSPASCLCCAAGCRGRCYRVKWDAAKAARAGDDWWSGNGPGSGVACMKPSSPSCADGDGSTNAERWWTAGRSAQCSGEKTGPNPTDRRKAGSKHHIVIASPAALLRSSCARRPLAWLHRFRCLAVRDGCALICWNYLKSTGRVF